MEIVYSIFIGMIVGMIVGMIDGIVLQCRRDRPAFVLINPSGPAFLQRAAVLQWLCPLLD